MFDTLSATPETIVEWDWSNFEPYYQDLKRRRLTADTVGQWLSDWARLSDFGTELSSRLYVATSVNTADTLAEERYKAFYDETYPRLMAAEQELKQMLLSSGLEPEGYEIPLRNMRAEADLFREANLPILAEENKVKTEYEKIVGAQTVMWEGEERTISQMHPVFQDTDRSKREQAWRIVAERQLADRDAINQVWRKLLGLRRRLAENAGRPGYRAYRWQEMLRFDYTPDDAHRFRDAIEEVVVPAATRVYERRCRNLGLDKLRPWDLDVDSLGRPPLRPFQSVQQLQTGVSAIFHQVDRQLGGYFDTLVDENLLDLANRKNKAPGAYCTGFPVIQRPFIFGNAVGLQDDVQMLLHESGHAFHVFESNPLPHHLRNVPMEFAEVASMGMELLASPYLTREHGGFYSPEEAARARIEFLEGIVLFWPYMAVVDGFQHWVYDNPEAAEDPQQCDAAWSRLWQRFMRGVDWSGFEEVMATGWHRKVHIHTDPFYYIEYGLAQLGAVQVWRNALNDQAGAVAAYRSALALGGKVTLPDLFRAAGARFALDPEALRQAVGLIEQTLAALQNAG